MKKGMKKKMIATFACVCVACAAIGVGVNNVFVKADEPTTPDFYIDGAGVRYATKAEEIGIRFHMLMKEDKYTQLVTDGNEIGMYFLPTDMLQSVDTDGVIDENDFAAAASEVRTGVTYGVVEEEQVNEWTASAEFGGYMEAYVYIYDIPAENANRPVSVIGYATSGETTEYTDAIQRSMAGVAWSAKQDGDTRTFGAYLDQEYTVDFLNEDGTKILETKKYKYGDNFTEYAYEDFVSDTEVLNGWKKRTGTNEGVAVWSETAYDMSAADAKFVTGNMQFMAKTRSVNIFAEFDTNISEVTTATNNTTTTYEWLEEFEGEKGVLKANLPKYSAVYDALRLGLNEEILNKANTAKMDYIRFRLYADDTSTISGVPSGYIRFRSHNCTFGTNNYVIANNWVDFEIPIANMVNAFSIESTTEDEIRAEVANEWKNPSVMFYLEEGAKDRYNLYIDSISWGCYTEEENQSFARFNSGISEISYGAANGSYSWLSSHEGANGVLKVTLPSIGQTSVTDYLRLGFNSTLVDKAVSGAMNYITFRIYISSEDTTAHATAGTTDGKNNAWFRSGNVGLGTVKTDEWVDFKIDLSTFVGAYNISATDAEGVRNEVASEWKSAFTFFYLHNNISSGNYTLYIDNISWGV